MKKTIRKLLKRINMAYRTISTEALYVIAGMMPIKCWVEEGMDRYRYGMARKETGNISSINGRRNGNRKRERQNGPRN